MDPKEALGIVQTVCTAALQSGIIKDFDTAGKIQQAMYVFAQLANPPAVKSNPVSLPVQDTFAADTTNSN